MQAMSGGVVFLIIVLVFASRCLDDAKRHLGGYATIESPTTAMTTEKASPAAATFTGDPAQIAQAIAAIKPVATGKKLDSRGRVIGTVVTQEDRDRANEQKVSLAAPLVLDALTMCKKQNPPSAATVTGIWGRETDYCPGLPAKRCDTSSAGAIGPTQHKRTQSGAWAFGEPGDDPEYLRDALRMTVRHLCEANRADGIKGEIVPSSDMAIMRYHGEKSYANPSEYLKDVLANRAKHEKVFASLKSGNAPLVASNTASPTAVTATAAPASNDGFMPMIGHPEKKLRTAIAVDGTPTATPIAVGEGYLTSLMGADRLINKQFDHAHGGDDFSAKEGVIIVAVADGIVEYADWHHDNNGPGARAGLHVRIGHNIGVSKKPGMLISTSSMHCQKALVSVGDRVQRGQPIALVGSTAVYNYGPHLHFQATVIGPNGTKQIADLDKYIDLSVLDPHSSLFAGPFNNETRARAGLFEKQARARDAEKIGPVASN